MQQLKTVNLEMHCSFLSYCVCHLHNEHHDLRKSRTSMTYHARYDGVHQGKCPNYITRTRARLVQLWSEGLDKSKCSTRIQAGKQIPYNFLSHPLLSAELDLNPAMNGT